MPGYSYIHTTNMETLDTFIKIKRGLFNAEFCDQILAEYETLTFSRGDHLTPVHVRNLSECNISNPAVSATSATKQKLEVDIHNKVSEVLDEFDGLQTGYVNGYSLRKMVAGDYYKQHVDSAPGCPSKLTVSVVLNDGFTGGKFCFFDRELCVTLNKGDCLAFPASFQYPHEVTEITSGTRFALVTWFC